MARTGNNTGSRSSRGRRTSGAANSRGRRQQNKPRPNKRKSGRGIGDGVRGLVWFLSGLALATAAAAVAYIVIQPDVNNRLTRAGTAGPKSVPATTESNAGTTRERSNDASAGVAGPNKPARNAASQPRFEFYRMLPDYDGPVDAAGDSSAPTADTSRPQAPAQNRAESAPTATRTTTAERAGQTTGNAGSGPWRIQAGAFSTREAARKRVARLTLMGLDVTINQQKTDSGQTIYRVYSQRIDSKQRLQDIRAKLAAKNIGLLVHHIGS